jgi:hypothetical protein
MDRPLTRGWEERWVGTHSTEPQNVVVGANLESALASGQVPLKNPFCLT